MKFELIHRIPEMMRHLSSGQLAIISIFAICVFVTAVINLRFRIWERRDAQRSSGMAHHEVTSTEDEKRQSNKVRWRYCRFWRKDHFLYIWARKGLSLDDTRKLLPRVFQRDTFLSIKQATGVFRFLGADFVAIQAPKGPLKYPRRIKHPPLGVDVGLDLETGESATVKFSEHGLILVGGLSGQGKTSLLKTLSEAREGVEVESFSLSGADFRLLKEPDLIRRLHDHVEEIKARDWQPSKTQPQKVLVIDEFLRYLHFSKQSKEEIAKHVGFIAAEGRKYGVTLILAVQKWSSMPTDLFSLASGTIAFRLANSAQGDALVGDGDVVELKKGFVLSKGFAWRKAQLYFRETGIKKS